jgi:hypothetical protein
VDLQLAVEDAEQAQGEDQRCSGLPFWLVYFFSIKIKQLLKFAGEPNDGEA